jgi:hypothetical protein
MGNVNFLTVLKAKMENAKFVNKDIVIIVGNVLVLEHLLVLILTPIEISRVKFSLIIHIKYLKEFLYSVLDISFRELYRFYIFEYYRELYILYL